MQWPFASKSGSLEGRLQNEHRKSSAMSCLMGSPSSCWREQRRKHASQMKAFGPATTLRLLRRQKEHSGGSAGGPSIGASVASLRRWRNRRSHFGWLEAVASARPCSARRRADSLSPRSSAAEQSVAIRISAGGLESSSRVCAFSAVRRALRSAARLHRGGRRTVARTALDSASMPSRASSRQGWTGSSEPRRHPTPPECGSGSGSRSARPNEGRRAWSDDCSEADAGRFASPRARSRERLQWRGGRSRFVGHVQEGSGAVGQGWSEGGRLRARRRTWLSRTARPP